MKKPFKHDQRSTVQCARCRKNIKANVAARKPEHAQLLCYRCWRNLVLATRGRTIRTARDMRKWPKFRSMSREHVPLKPSA